MARPLYLDYAATTPLAPEVLERMMPYLTSACGNASSRSHAYGWEARAAVERSAEQVAQAFGAQPEELVFTSGSTEALNLALKGYARRYGSATGRRTLVTCATEHAAVLDPLRSLTREGYRLLELAPRGDGPLDPEVLADALDDDTLLVALMYVNNETGVVHPIPRFAGLAYDCGAAFCCDATQATGRLALSVKELSVDLLACSGHKVYGPKGSGLLYVRDAGSSRGVKLEPLMHGGGHQRGLRSGTLDVPGIVGLAAAVDLAARRRGHEHERLAQLRERFEDGLCASVELAEVNAAGAPRAPHISNVTLPYVDAEALLSRLGRQLAVSTGSACAAERMEPSHVLTAMGLAPDRVRSSIRVSFGRDTGDEDVDRAVALVVSAARELRAESPLWELHLAGVLGPGA